ncbi:MAG: hypothetical protein IKW28_08385 [Lachnospiraceae bacterium]|nr:hypothetical protein [Lachnospiraceae bacterium]
MKNSSGNHSSSLFLLELVVAILIFAMASALSLQFFARAHLWNNNAKALNFFSNECATVAEINGVSSSKEALIENLLQLYPRSALSEGGFTLFYDETFTLCGRDKSRYVYTISLEEKDSFLITFMKVWDSSLNTVVYELESKHYPGGFSL